MSMRDYGYNISSPDQITTPQVIAHQDHEHITDFNILEVCSCYR